MKLLGIFRRLFRRVRVNTIDLDRDEALKKYREKSSGEYNMDKSIFEILYTVEMKGNTSIISGRVKRGFFRTGDNIVICPPTDAVPKAKAVVVNIKTSLVDVNKIGVGAEADLLVEIPDGIQEIKPGYRVYNTG